MDALVLLAQGAPDVRNVHRRATGRVLELACEGGVPDGQAEGEEGAEEGLRRGERMRKVGRGKESGGEGASLLFLRIVVWQPFKQLAFNHCACRRSAGRIS